jgi:hypothetical protein
MARMENKSEVLRRIMEERIILHETGQAMHVSRNTEARSCKPFLQWKNNTYYIFLVCVCVCVALGMQHAMRMRHVFICGLYGRKIFFHVIL